MSDGEWVPMDCGESDRIPRRTTRTETRVIPDGLIDDAGELHDLAVTEWYDGDRLVLIDYGPLWTAGVGYRCWHVAAVVS